MGKRPDDDRFCPDCGEYLDDCKCWLDEPCPCCLAPLYGCRCDDEDYSAPDA
ncbi:hypothetical protein KOR34_02420 [Posidoniimonas corsicana]|uniref:Uncharacterized protein n=1 Tax=Posidoniimonas corsicana TaxID=1938618 RepID=A0A5C5VAL5_9BACT|nr:hypothetical protein [Posidoniimonas corsicana]TWT35351.1 hypothetical protein KOR34_02420 [Posidoniimonas corsicana]